MKIIITETQYKLLMVEQLQIAQPNNPSDYLGKGRQFEKMNKIQDPLRIPLNKGLNLNEIMESFREKLFSPAGVTIEVFLTSLGWTAPAVMAAYGAILSFDIYKSINGETDWFNIVVDVIGIVTSGAFSGLFAPLMRGAKKRFNSIVEVFKWLKTTKVWESLKPYLSKIVSGLSNVGKWLSTGIKWIADNTGLTFLLKWSSKILSFFNNISKQILDFISKETSESVGSIINNTKVAQSVGAASKAATAELVLDKGTSYLEK